MFLVEREPGNVTVYNSAAELSSAFRQGIVGPTARIFHRRSSQWLPITEHPAYRQAQAEAEREPLPPLRRRHWTFLPGSPASPASPASVSHPQPDDRASASATVRSNGTGDAPPKAAAAKTHHRWWPDSLRRAVDKMRSRGPAKPS